MSVFQVYDKTFNLWFVPLVFVVFFLFSIIFGGKPLFDAAKMSPIKAISSVQYFGLGKGGKLKPLSKTGLTLRIASRSLFRRKSGTIRVAIFLSVIFLLLTVCIAGGIIANDTTTSWIKKATGQNVILIADNRMADQYTQLQLAFSGAKSNPSFNYSDPTLAVSDRVIQELMQVPGIASVSSQLVWSGTIQEVPGWYVIPDTLTTQPIGGNRQGISLVIGIDTSNIINEPYVSGQFLNSTLDLNAVIGDSVNKAMFKSFSAKFSLHGTSTTLGDALRERLRVENTTFKITGICQDPINNGNVTYIALASLKKITGISSPDAYLPK